ncbi:MAG: hypothetical protein E7480_07645 [Ruminococcaceae bacterium]|nr:hypothetical protein [Oscillospiraceae bacterium]
MASCFSNYKNLINDKQNRISFVLLVAFVVLNAVKVSLFNFVLLGDLGRLWDFIYKLILSIPFSAFFLYLFLNFKKRWIFLSAYILQTAYIFANLAYYLYFYSYLHIFQWIFLLSEGFTMTANLMIPVGIEMILIFIDLPLFIYIIIKYNFVKKIKQPLLLPAILVSVIAVLVFIFSEIYYDANKSLVEKAEPAAINSETVLVKRYGTVVNEVINVFTNTNEEERVEKVKFGKPYSSEQTKEEFPNIFYIQVESLDAGIIYEKYNGEYVAPFLASLREKSVYYPYTLSYHLGGGTSDCEFSTLNGVEAIAGFPAIKLKSFDFSNSFVHDLKASGYATYAFHSNEADFFTRDEAYAKMGYDSFFGIKELELEEKGWGASDGDLFDAAFKKLENEKGPFFAHIITMTSHEPYTNISKIDDTDYFPDILNSEVNNYFNSIKYVDSCIEKFVTEALEKYPNSYFYIFGDHCSGINEEEYAMSSYVLNNKHFELVPTFIITPDKLTYKEEERVASFRDFALTVLNSAGIKYDILSEGFDLLDFGNIGKEVSFREEYYDRKVIYENIASAKYHRDLLKK